MIARAKDQILRAKILLGADKLFQKYGLAKTTMEDIAKEAGKGKSTLYYYFKSKEEIFDVIVQAEKTRFFNELQESVSKAPTAMQKLQVYTSLRFEKIRLMTNLYNVMFREAVDAFSSGEPSAIACYRAQYDQKQVDIIKSILQFGIITGEIRVLPESDIEMIAFVHISALNGMEMDLIIYNRIDEMISRMDLFHDLFYNGLRK
jgi:AcrR family transcriptional regulator